MLKKLFILLRILFFIPFLSGCFFANMFDFGPKIDLAKHSEWKIDYFILGGKTYTLQGYEEIPSMRFDVKELKLYGNTGCNTFFANYTWVDEKKLEMRNSGLTRKMCQSQDAMKFEQKLMEEFDGEFEVIEEESKLTLKKENLEIVLTPLPQEEKTQEKPNLDNVSN